MLLFDNCNIFCLPNLAMVKDVYMNVCVHKANQEASMHLKTLKYANDKWHKVKVLCSLHVLRALSVKVLSVESYK